MVSPAKMITLSLIFYRLMAVTEAPYVLSFVLLFSVVKPEEKLSTLPGEVKFDRDRDTLFIRCQVEIID